MMEKTLTENLLKDIPAPDVFEVFFFRPCYDGNLFDKLFAKAVVDYHRMYKFSGGCVHVAMRLGSYVYEVTTEGTTRQPWSEDYIDDPRILSFFTADIKNIEVDRRLAALFTVENMVGRKLDVCGSLSYLWQTVGFGKTMAELDRMTYNSMQTQLALPRATYVKGKKPKFNLPYTCTSPTNAVLKHLINFEPSFCSHLGQAVAFSLCVIADMGFGVLYNAEDTEDDY